MQPALRTYRLHRCRYVPSPRQECGSTDHSYQCNPILIWCCCSFVNDLQMALEWLDAHFIYTPDQVTLRCSSGNDTDTAADAASVMCSKRSEPSSACWICVWLTWLLGIVTKQLAVVKRNVQMKH